MQIVQLQRQHSQRGQRWVISVCAVILAMMAIQMSSLGFSPLLPDMQRDLAASYSQIGLFTGMYGLIALTMSLPAGILAARIGEKRGIARRARGCCCWIGEPGQIPQLRLRLGQSGDLAHRL